MTQQFDTIIIGAGAAGLFCAPFAAERGGRVLVVDHAKKPGEKIRISGGGRCNFTNLHCGAHAFISQNPHFCKSALARFSQWDFLAVLEDHGVIWHEKTLGQLFCDGKSGQIIEMLLERMDRAGASLQLDAAVTDIRANGSGFCLKLNDQEVECSNLVVACGGKSIPKMGATGYGYDIARQFDLGIVPTRPGLVPFTLSPSQLEQTSILAGIASDVSVSCNNTSFDEAMLFTHRGLSGPAMLQISSYWNEGDALNIAFQNRAEVYKAFVDGRTSSPGKSPLKLLTQFMPGRLAEFVLKALNAHGKQGDQLANFSNSSLRQLDEFLNGWVVKPGGTEGYRTAEVTAGGVTTDDLDPKTMEARRHRGLYFIGEVVDVTGWLGGYNFQWAWSSAWVAGKAISARN